MQQIRTHGVCSLCHQDLLPVPPPEQTSFQTHVLASPIGKSICRFFVQDLRKVKFKTFSSKKGGGYLQIILRKLPIRLPCKTYRRIGLPAGLASRSNWQSLCPTQSPTSPREPHGSLRHAGVTPWPPRTVFLHGMGRQGAGVSNITQARHKAPMIMKRQF